MRMNGSRTLVSGLAATLIFFGFGIPAAATAGPVVLEMQAQPLSTALREFARQTGIQIAIQSELTDGKTAPRLTGQYEPEAALAALLEGSGLVAYPVNEKTYGVRAIGTNSASGKSTAARSDMDAQVLLAQADRERPAASAGHHSATRPEDTQLEEIVVTAQKRVERLQDVPVPMTALSAETLTRTNQLRLEDYYSKVPGLSLGLSGDSGAPTISIRGISTGARTNPTVGVVVDEVSYGASALMGSGVIVNPTDIDPGDLARIEVLRGPQGTLYGASSIGGLLKFVTADPSTEQLAGRVQVGTSSIRHGDTGYSVRGHVNVPLGDTFAMRASAFTARDPGFIDNATTGQRDVNNYDSEGGRLSALWRPSDALSLKLSALIQDSERLGTDNVDTALGRENFRQAFLPGTGKYTRKTEAYSATLVAQLASVELTSATGYSTDQKVHNLDFSDILGGVFAQQAFDWFGMNHMSSFQDTRIEKFTQEVRASIPLGERVNWLVGGFYTDEDYNFFARNDAMDPTGAFVGTVIDFGYDPAAYEEYAAFSTVMVQLTDRWDMQIGGRYSDHNQNSRLVIGGISVGGGPINQPAIDSSTEAFTYLITPRFKVAPDLMVYARLASGFRPGGPNSLCGQSLEIPCEFDPDETRNYDIGMKGQLLGGALSFDAAVYYIDWKDIQLQGIQTSDGALSYTGNVSRARSQGVEIALESKLSAGWPLSGWVSYNDATMRAAFPPGPFVPFGEKGTRLPYSARLTGNISLDREFPLWGTATGSLGGSWTYVGDRKGGFGLQIDNGSRETFPSYTRLDLNGRIEYETWTLNLFINNVTDERGVLRGGLDAEFTPRFFTYIEPRTVGLSLAKDF
jgi:iron complex outermembrane recepter protein